LETHCSLYQAEAYHAEGCPKHVGTHLVMSHLSLPQTWTVFFLKSIKAK